MRVALLLSMACAVLGLAGCAELQPYRADGPATAYDASSEENFSLVSDIDDTVKITNVCDKSEAAKNAIESKLIFAGMPELYKSILKTHSRSELWFLSGGPEIFKHNVDYMLASAKFPFYKLTLRENHAAIMTGEGYKSSKLKEKYGASQGQFILIGDDTEWDPDEYKAFSTEKPNQVLAIYIHIITGEKLPASSPKIISFTTAFDIAIHEFLAKRISIDDALEVGNAVDKSDLKSFFPSFQNCTENFRQVFQTELPGSIVTIQKLIYSRIDNICARRDSSYPLTRQCKLRSNFDLPLLEKCKQRHKSRP